MAGTTVWYGNVQLHNCKTLGWSQEIVYDDSKTDQMFVRYKLRFECLLHAQAYAQWSKTDGSIPIFTGDFNSNELAHADSCMSLREMLRRLKSPRQELRVTMGNNIMLDVRPFTASGGGGDTEGIWLDVENGPKPQRVEVTQLTTGQIAGAAVFTLNFEIDCTCLLCPSGNVNFVISNRWSIGESMDANFFTTRSITGKMRVASAALNAEIARLLILPSLEYGFRRDSIDYSVAADGLEVTYTVKDRQVYQAAPWPCTRMEGTHTESTKDGILFNSTVQVEVEGHPGASKAAMLAWIIGVMESRLGDLSKLNTAQKGPNGKAELAYVESCVFTDHIGERNVISGQLQITHSIDLTPDSNGNVSYDAVSNISIGKFGSPLKLAPLGTDYTYDSTVSKVPAAWGYDVQAGDDGRSPAARLLLACYLQSPCYDRHNIGNAATPSSQYTPYTAQKQPPAVQEHQNSYTLPGSPSPSTSLSSSQQQAIYTVSTMETHWHQDPVKVQIPIASASLKASDDTCVLATLGPTQASVEFHYEAERFMAQPQIPEPKNAWALASGLKASLMRHYVRLHPPTVTANATGKVYRTEAYYVYALNRPPLPTESIPIGILPALSYTARDNSVSLKDLYDPAQAFDAANPASAKN